MTQFIGTSTGVILNLAAVVMIEDVTDKEGGPGALVTTTTGYQFEIAGPDANSLFERVALLLEETEHSIQRIRHAAAIAEANVGITTQQP